ncbi:hypothetical protein LTR66_013437 [Elasticomyces elasticus]|nr:hypothetical protein LTR66_013437 [Elasticomyces elasticus]KAK4989774.1 hypothetical protein LTR50_002948 [Elasticomyces elasticus]
MAHATHSMSMGTTGMTMVFFTSTTTPLFSSSWAPSTTGAYAGTCIFLVLLTVISRALMAYKQILEHAWHDRAVNRRYVVVADENDAAAKELKGDVEVKEEAVLTTRGLDERVRIVRQERRVGAGARTRAIEGQPWRFSVDLPRACIFTVQVGVGYLLMLAVMTLNVGYFVSVLAGAFLGELAVGRYIHMDDEHH